MKYILLFIALLSIGCSKYNMDFGSTLADFQDQKFEDYKAGKTLSDEEMTRLKNNLWVKTAYQLAPGNLVVRQYCLIDLYKNKTSNKRKIGKLLEQIGSDIWREGYSYWLYTKSFLLEYDKKFKRFGPFITDMDERFQQTSYMGPDGKLYPAPYGDLRHVPLENFLQGSSSALVNSALVNIEIYPLIINYLSPTLTEYLVQPCPLGFNTHVPSKAQRITVDSNNVCIIQPESGGCVPFHWYEGYDKKYKDKEDELRSTFSEERFNSLNVHLWWKKYKELFLPEE